MSRTIRVGSGTDSLGGFFGSSPDEVLSTDSSEDAGEETEASETPLEGGDAIKAVDGLRTGDTDASEGATGLDDILNRADQAVSDVRNPSETTPKTPAGIVIGTPDVQEPAAPAEKPVEKALDDGLY